MSIIFKVLHPPRTEEDEESQSQLLQWLLFVIVLFSWWWWRRRLTASLDIRRPRPRRRQMLGGNKNKNNKNNSSSNSRLNLWGLGRLFQRQFIQRGRIQRIRAIIIAMLAYRSLLLHQNSFWNSNDLVPLVHAWMTTTTSPLSCPTRSGTTTRTTTAKESFWSSRIQQTATPLPHRIRTKRDNRGQMLLLLLLLSSRNSWNVDDEYHADMQRILHTKRILWENQQYPLQQQQQQSSSAPPQSDHNQNGNNVYLAYAPFAPWFFPSSQRQWNDDNNDHHGHAAWGCWSTSLLTQLRHLNRRQRPPMVQEDFDGAERVHEMLGELVLQQQQQQQQRLLGQQSLGQQQERGQGQEPAQNNQRVVVANGFFMMRSYEIVLQAYLQRGRLRWWHGLDHPSEEDDEAEGDTIDILFDPHYLYDWNDDDDNDDSPEEPRDGGHAFRRRHRPSRPRGGRVVCAADVADDLYRQWLEQQQQETSESSSSSSSTSSSSSLWNPVSACWLAAQAVCATPRGGAQRNYARRALDFVHALRHERQQRQRQEHHQHQQQQQPTGGLVHNNGDHEMPVEALLYGIHAAAWQQGSSSPFSAMTTNVNNNDDNNKNNNVYRESVGKSWNNNDKNNNDNDKTFDEDSINNNENENWALEAHELWEELVAILQPDRIVINEAPDHFNNDDNNKKKKNYEYYAEGGSSNSDLLPVKSVLGGFLAYRRTFGHRNQRVDDKNNNKYKNMAQLRIRRGESGTTEIQDRNNWNGLKREPATTRTMLLSSSSSSSLLPSLQVCMLASAWTVEAWSKSGIPGSGSKAQAILNQMVAWNATMSTIRQQEELEQQQVHNVDYSKDLLLDAEVYSNVIMAWSKDGVPDRAQEVLEEMIDLYRHGGLSVVSSTNDEMTSIDVAGGGGDDDDDDHDRNQLANPTSSLLPTIAFNSVISAWGKKGDTSRAIQVLKLMLGRLDKSNVHPHHLQQSNDNHQDDMFGIAGVAQSIVAAPNAISYNTILNAFLHAHQNNEGSSKDNQKKPYKKIEKESITESNARSALSLVRYMEDNQRAQPAIQPNSMTYYLLIRILLLATTRSPGKRRGTNKTNQENDDSQQQEQQQYWMSQICVALEQLLRLWREGDRSTVPGCRIFNMVINAYAKSNSRNNNDIIRIVIKLLEQMKQSTLVEIQPDIITWTTVMECLSKHPTSLSSSSSSPAALSTLPNASTLALELVQQALDKYKETSRPEYQPNVRLFTMAIRTLSENRGSVQDARNLLTQLVDLYEAMGHDDLKPNTFPYNYVLSCAANSLAQTPQDKQDAFRLAAQTYKELRQSPYETVQPDSFTYSFWLKCCNNLLLLYPKSVYPRQAELHEKCIRYAIQECKDRGLVTQQVITRLRQGCPTWLVQELLELNDDDDEDQRKTLRTSNNNRSRFSSSSYQPAPQIADLPLSWRRNGTGFITTKRNNIHNSDNNNNKSLFKE